jgi:hypothetical protein
MDVCAALVADGEDELAGLTMENEEWRALEKQLSLLERVRERARKGRRIE